MCGQIFIPCLHFVTFVDFCSKNFSSVLQSSRRREIWCHSSIKFDRLRPFLVIHRLLAIISPFFGVFEFDQVRPSSNPIISPRRAEDVNPRILCSLPFRRQHVAKEFGAKVRASSPDFDHSSYFIGFQQSFVRFSS